VKNVVAGAIAESDVPDFNLLVVRLLLFETGGTFRTVHTDEAGQGRLADLELVEPGENAVEGIAQLNGVQGGGGGGAEGDDVVEGQRSTPHEGAGDREGEGEVDGGEPAHPKKQGVGLGVERLSDIPIDAQTLTVTESQCFDGPRSIDGL
jgi:hypothetical protein